MALAETGYDGSPHAYAVRIGGRSYYAKSEARALDHARQSDGKLDASANIGCMQLQVASHGKAFTPPEKIIDPALNVRRAAGLLVAGAGRRHNWSQALASYQGGPPEARRAYVCRIWNYVRYLAPATATLIDARACGQMPHPTIDLNTARIAHETRQRLTLRK